MDQINEFLMQQLAKLGLEENEQNIENNDDQNEVKRESVKDLHVTNQEKIEILQQANSSLYSDGESEDKIDKLIDSELQAIGEKSKDLQRYETPSNSNPRPIDHSKIRLQMTRTIPNTSQRPNLRKVSTSPDRARIQAWTRSSPQRNFQQTGFGSQESYQKD